MFGLAVTVSVLALIALVVFFVAKRTHKDPQASSYDKDTAGAVKMGAGIGVVALSLAAIGFWLGSMLFSVDQGQVGVEVLFGKVVKTHEPGLHLKSPLSGIVKYSTRPIETTYTNTVSEGDVQGEDAIDAFSLENARITADVTILWSIDPTMASQVYGSAGGSEERVREVLIRPVTRSRVRDCIGTFRFEEARTVKFQALSDCMVTAMRADLAPRGIIIQSVLLRRMEADPVLQAAIEQKLQAEQAVQEAEFRRQQSLIDKDTTIINAEAEAERIQIEAGAKAEANDLEGASLDRNPILVQLRIVEALGDHSVVLLPQGGTATPLIQIPQP